MKSLVLLVTLLPLSVVATPDFSTITRALNSGDVGTLAKHFDSTVEVTVMDDDGVYNKSQATEVVKKFFAANPPQSFKLVHQGTNNKNLHYCIGDMVAGGTTYRVSFYLKEVNGNFMIQEIGFEEE